MRLWPRRVTPEERLAAEIERTGILVDIRYSTYALEWSVDFVESCKTMTAATHDQAIRYALRVLARAPNDLDEV